jgi:predicted nucleic acid-binding protein
MGGLSWWDAMIVASAQEAGAVRLLTEDMQEGRRFGDLIVENPFA